MATCIEAATWNKAYSDCEKIKQTTLKGYTRTGMSGLGDLAVAPNYDPCAIAAQPSCQPRPPGLQTSTYTKKVTTPPPATASVSTAGFSQWGLLAAVLVGGAVVYKVSTRKKA